MKRQTRGGFGWRRYARAKGGGSEAGVVWREGNNAGWAGRAERNAKARRKSRREFTRQKTQLDKMGLAARLGARLSGKRRRIIREVMAKEAKLRSIDQLEQRQRVLRRHFPL